MIVVAHPDDETIGIGGHLGRLHPTHIVHVTDGAPRNGRDATKLGFYTRSAYAAARRAEVTAAIAEAGIEANALISFGIPDQEAARHMASIARRLQMLITKARPSFICTHAYEGGHPDHDAIALAVNAACLTLDCLGRPRPQIIEMAFYRASPTGAVFQDFSPDIPDTVLEIRLDDAAIALKQRMLEHFVTQKRLLASFSTQIERFRAAPAYDFSQPPNGGLLLYEQWQLGVTGGEWLRLAEAAARELGWAK
ncbi:MAG TPA: PIG-L family deacetylase [Rhizobiaceae bacterium]|nr:PIG-L family deacetylase [Rhizobiaceae bacterium]